MCKKTRGSKRIDNYFSLPSNSQQRDDADAVIVNEQTEDFEESMTSFQTSKWWSDMVLM